MTDVLVSQSFDLSRLLEEVAAELDIPAHLYEDAVAKYSDVGTWLSEENSPLARYSPDVYPQGSFRLGTVVRPMLREDEFDIDLVCHMTIAKASVSQRVLKALVGDRLKQRDDLREMLEESRRCWRLNYDDPFHMDVLPAIPNDQTPPDGILLTDTELARWQSSNPRAYADWFYGRMRVILNERRVAKAQEIRADVEDVPEWTVRTPLQRVVQLLKRHRDVYFQNAADMRPVSIIITTLAAHSYDGQPDTLTALQAAVARMPLFIEKRGDKWWVQNPVDAGENFADKWNEKPAKREAFLGWLGQAQADLDALRSTRELPEVIESVARSLGRGVATKVAARANPSGMGYRLVTAAPTVPGLANDSHALRPTWPTALTNTARIAASVYMRKNGRLLRPLAEQPVSKKLWIRFTAKTDVRPPFAVQWQVTNTGDEALAARQPRGNFEESDEGTVRWEQTAYRGTHWVQAFILKDGYCVARTERTLVRVR